MLKKFSLKSLPLKKILPLILSAAAGGLLSLGRVFAYPAPFAAVLPAILPPALGTAALVGTCIGGFLSSSLNAIPLAAASGAALLSRLRLKTPSGARSGFTVSALPSAVYFMSSAALAAFSGGGLPELLRSLAFSAMLFALTAASYKAALLYRSAKPLPPALALMLCGAAVCALCQVRFFVISFGGIFAAMAILYSSVRYGPMASAAVSAVCALGAGISSPGLFSAYAVFSAAGIVCGAAAFGSPIRAAAVFLSLAAPLCVIFGGSGASLDLFLDCAVGTVLFTVTYRRLFAALSPVFTENELPEPSLGGQLLRGSLESVSSRLLGLSEKAELPKRNLSDAIYSKVCLGCEKNHACFENGADGGPLDSLPQSMDMAEICRALPCCSKISEVRRVGAEARRRGDYAASKRLELKTTSRLCAEMLKAAEYVILDSEAAAKKSSRADRLLTERFTRSLKRSGMRYKSCAVYPSGSAEVIFPLNSRINEVRAAADLSEMTGLEYSRPERRETGECVSLRFLPKPIFTAEPGFCQLSAKPEACGDAAESYTVGNISYTVLSDGMGVGGEARAVSELLSDLIREFISAGFSAMTAISLASLVLRSSAPEESFATVDLLKVDLTTGAAELYKAGGCESCLCADGSRSLLRAGGYPVGILSPLEVEIRRFYVKDSAAVIMATDGAGGIFKSEAVARAAAAKNSRPSELAAGIISSLERPENVKNDDATVAVVKIERKTA